MSRLPFRLAPVQWQPTEVELEPAADAVVRGSGSFAVVAGPGAGKTELLAQKAVFLFLTGGCPAPRRILAISFKKDAAKNLAERVKMRCRPEHAARFDSMTFDAFAKGLLDRFRNALPERFRPPPDYQVSLEKEDDYSRLNSLTFRMISKLVIILLQKNPLLVKALRLTYSHLFLDEFQDTTKLQYEFVKTVFHGSSTCLTSVGDYKQRIMVWAGAAPGIFEAFTNDFSATKKELLFNHRSVPELVRIQHYLAGLLDPNPQVTQSRRNPVPNEQVCAIWNFNSVADQTNYLAQFFQGEFQAGHGPRDFLLLVRQKADQLENLLRSSFANAGLNLRNESRTVAGIQIQDLLTEPLTIVLLSFLKLGAAEKSGEHWRCCSDLLTDLRAFDSDDMRKAEELDHKLGRFIKRLHGMMKTVPTQQSALSTILQNILEFVPASTLITSVPQYRQGDWFDKTRQGFEELLWESCQNASNWETVLARFEGIHDIPLMTIHKSKGLEFPTVIYVGLDDEQFWSMNNNPDEGIATFFVAFTRAEKRVFVTYANRGDQKVKQIYNALERACIPKINHPPQPL